MGLSSEEVDLHEVLEWVYEQTVFLPHSSHRMVLMYLCINAWRHDRNRQGALPGDVLPKATSLAAIQRATGLTDKTVRKALQDLQDNGYLVANMQPGYGKSAITVFWSEAADERRADFRAGIRDLPKGFQRARKKVEEEGSEEQQDAVVLQFRSGNHYRNTPE